MLEEDAVLDAHVIPRARTSGARTVVGNMNIAIFVNVYIITYICECVAYIFDSNVSIDSASKLYQPITMCSVSDADRGQLGTPGRACPQAEQAIAPRRESAWTEMSQDTRSRPYVL